MKKFIYIFSIMAICAASTFVEAKTIKAINAKCAADTNGILQSQAVVWYGDCSKNKANGAGVLRPKNEEAFTGYFVGNVVNGKPNIGVVVTDTGYIVYPQTDDRNLNIKAFDIAAKAAQKTSKSFAKDGNLASSKFYSELALKLSNQMD